MGPGSIDTRIPYLQGRIAHSLATFHSSKRGPDGLGLLFLG